MAEATYFASVLASAAGASKRHLAIFNAAGSGKTLKVYKVRAATASIAAVTGLAIALSAIRITAAPSGGSAVVIGKADTTDPGVPSQVTAMAAATGGATEEAGAFGVGAVSGEETQAPGTAVLYEFSIDGGKPIVCREGQGVLVKQGALASAGAVSVVITFTLV